MPVHKVTKFLSEISTFFKKSDSETAMFAIMDVIKGIKMNEQTLFRTQEPLQQQVFAAAGVPAFVSMSLFHDS